MNCTRPCTLYASPITSAHCALCLPGHWLLFGAPPRGLALLIGMAYGASSAADSLDDNSDLSRTRTATGHRKRSSSQTAAQRKEGMAAERLLHIPFFRIHRQLTERIFTLFPYSFFVITHLSNS